jgi:hypothetical protein
VVGSANARLLYGAVSPTTTVDDVALLTSLVVSNYVQDAADWLRQLDIPLDISHVSQLTPGEQGSWLGEQACALLSRDTDGWIDVHAVLAGLDIVSTTIDLTDEEVRAVSVFVPTHSQSKSNDSRLLMNFVTSSSIGNMVTNWLLPPGLGPAASPTTRKHSEQVAGGSGVRCCLWVF